jgi:hypothetical protein
MREYPSDLPTVVPIELDRRRTRLNHANSEKPLTLPVILILSGSPLTTVVT